MSDDTCGHKGRWCRCVKKSNDDDDDDDDDDDVYVYVYVYVVWA